MVALLVTCQGVGAQIAAQLFQLQLERIVFDAGGDAGDLLDRILAGRLLPLGTGGFRPDTQGFPIVFYLFDPFE
ncbi:hypothetical protein D3C75_779410 [compost metagenome]